MYASPNEPSHSWISKFRYAFRGLGLGLSEQNSFLVHIPIAGAALLAASLLRVTPAEWCVLTLCIVIVFSAEMFNSALEHMAKAVSREYCDELRDALDAAAAAVLVAALGSVVIAVIIFVPRLLPLLS